jgi:hypothetical protein
LAYTVEIVWHQPGYDTKELPFPKAAETDPKAKCSMLSRISDYLVRLGVDPFQEMVCPPAPVYDVRRLALVAVKFGHPALAETMLKHQSDLLNTTVSSDLNIIDNAIIDVVEILSGLGREEDLNSKSRYLLGQVSPAWPVDVADDDRKRIIRLSVRFLKTGTADLGDSLLAKTLAKGSEFYPFTPGPKADIEWTGSQGDGLVVKCDFNPAQKVSTIPVS